MNVGLPRVGSRQLVTFGRNSAKQCSFSFGTLDNFDNCKDAEILHGRDFMKVINIQGNLRMSPWRISNKYPTPGDIASNVYQEIAIEELKRGSSPTLADQLSMVVDRDLAKFTGKSLLISPPLLIQTRQRPGDCESAFSTSIVDQYSQVGKDRQCRSPYASCDDVRIYECPAGVMEESFFGIEPTSFCGQEKAFVEYLAAITDHDILMRKNNNNELELKGTDQFLDTLTTQVQIASMFYSVEYGITTFLNISFKTSGGRVEGMSTVKHFVALTGDTLAYYMQLQLSVVVCMAVLLVDNIKCIASLIFEYRETERINWGFCKIVALDLTIQAFMIFFLIRVMNEKNGSGDITSDLVGKLTELPWFDRTLSYDNKQRTFIDIFERIDKEISKSETTDLFGMIVALILLNRIVLATSAHPRIALITDTLAEAAQDLFHFMLIFLLIFICFAIIATWRFGAKMQELSTTGTAFLTQFNALLGPPGFLEMDLDDSLDYVIYALLFHSICFFFMVNFVLAIVVDAFSKVTTKLQECSTEQDLISDTYALLRTLPEILMHKWPPRHRIVKFLETNSHATQKKYLTVDDIEDGFPAGKASAEKFVAYYKKYDFLTTSEDDDDIVTGGFVMAKNIARIVRKVEHISAELQSNGPGARDRAPSITMTGGTMERAATPSASPALEGRLDQVLNQMKTQAQQLEQQRSLVEQQSKQIQQLAQQVQSLSSANGATMSATISSTNSRPEMMRSYTTQRVI